MVQFDMYKLNKLTRTPIENDYQRGVSRAGIGSRRWTMLINNKFKVGRKIGSGNFGEIRLGKDTTNGTLVAVKFESARNEHRQLAVEFRCYCAIHSAGKRAGFPEVFFFGCVDKCNVLVMELLGPSLEELFVMCNRFFSVSTVMEIARQLVSDIFVKIQT